MSLDQVDLIARAVLYEGYLLYPYRTSSVKNRHRFTFGGLYPPAFDSSVMQTQCLVLGTETTRVQATVRFLQTLGDPAAPEVVERSVEAPGPIAFDPLEGVTELSQEPVAPGVYRITVRIANTSPAQPVDRDDALRYSLLSTHTVLRVTGGAFASLTDPPIELQADAAACRNQGTWPVLVGEEGDRRTILSSPIILEDYPRVAEESPGDLFDGTEIDELLSLSILSLTDAEREEMRQADDRARALLERTEALTADQLMRLHATMRSPRLLREDGP